jgi:hypothetical protein
MKLGIVAIYSRRRSVEGAGSHDGINGNGDGFVWAKVDAVIERR